MAEQTLSAVQLEVVRHALAGVADEMGVALRRAAYSPNIKERADCSAAVFDADGQMVVHARHPAPVAAGNVETSQRIVDVLLAAFASAVPARVPAASQGTMSNLLLGASEPFAFSYYETLGGGEGRHPQA